MTTAAPASLTLPRLGGWRAKPGSPIHLEGGLGAALPGRRWGPPGCSPLTAWFPEVGQSAVGKREGGGNEKRKLLFFPLSLEMKEYTSKFYFLKDVFQCCSWWWSRAAGICVRHPGPCKLQRVFTSHFMPCSRLLHGIPLPSSNAGKVSILAQPGWRAIPFPCARE